MAGTAPTLDGEAKRAVEHRDSHLQIVASAGAGKTEVVSQRVASLLADGVPTDGIVAFTFTERAARELKERIRVRVAERLGPDAVDKLGGLFVGTIHAYCFQLLQSRIARYETYDVLDTNQLNAFLAREAKRLRIKQLDPEDRMRLHASIAQFLKALDVIENELLDIDDLTQPVRSIVTDYFDLLERYRFLTFGQQVVRAVRELEDPQVAAGVHRNLRHLIVDEYQDINPAQERLISLLTGPDTELCVVGDDDQAIYQWRGSDVRNIIEFTQRYDDVATFRLTDNRRSRPMIVDTAHAFTGSIPDRLAKKMTPVRPSGRQPGVTVWCADTETDEVGEITHMILDLHDDHGVAYRDIAVLARSRAVYPRLLDSFATFDIPVQPAGRTGLFEQPEADLLGRTFAWLAGVAWRRGYEWDIPVEEDDLVADYVRFFTLGPVGRTEIRSALREWKKVVPDEKRTADLVREFYTLLELLDVKRLNLDDPIVANRVGTLARFSNLLADYESVRRRARVSGDGEQTGGQRGGLYYYRGLATLMVNYAQGAYDGFDGEPDVVTDAVDVTTVHGAKGLEWPVVFVPSLTANRFPNRLVGRQETWPISRDRFPVERYEGSDTDERRLFYVAMTRARDWLSLSRHGRVTSRSSRSSPYWDDVGKLVGITDPADVVLPSDHEPTVASGDRDIEITFSEMASFMDCGMAFRLRNQFGFQPRLAPELGYGKAVHHVLRMVAERTVEVGRVPSPDEITRLLDDDFYLPAANKPAHENLKSAARRLIDDYVTNHADDLRRVWETERPFELYLDGVTVSGRADVILDEEGGIPSALAILDYKTSTDPDSDHGLQLQVYADAGRREGLDVRGAYVHDLKAGARIPVDVTDAAIDDAEEQVIEAATQLRARQFDPNPGDRCRTCDVRAICRHAKY